MGVLMGKNRPFPREFLRYRRTRKAACLLEGVGAAMNWIRLLIEKEMSSRVLVRYMRRPVSRL